MALPCDVIVTFQYQDNTGLTEALKTFPFLLLLEEFVKVLIFC